MKKRFLYVLLLLPLLIGCNKQKTPQIVATTLPVYEFTTALCAGTGISVSRLITENVSCLHDYTLQVSQMQTVESAQVVIVSGAGLEDFLTDILQNANQVIDASQDVVLSCGDLHEDHTHAHDPHIWLSPENAKQMSENICRELSVLYPAHAEQFQQNLLLLLAELDSLQQFGKTELQNLKTQDIITFHDGFSYFAESFDLHILKAIEEESGSETSAKELIEIIDLVEGNCLPAVFAEINGSHAAAQIIAAETGVKIFSLDMAMSGDSYFDAMYHNIRTIKEALE